jgi:hypothetical protein
LISHLFSPVSFHKDGAQSDKGCAPDFYSF